MHLCWSGALLERLVDSTAIGRTVI